jgi:integrase
MGKVTTDKPKITDIQIKAWINSQVHFEFKAVDTNLFLTFPERFTVPVFKFRYRMGGGKKREIMTMGSYGTISLSDARKMAKQFNGQIANGISPKMELGKRKAAAARDENAFTVEKLTARYFDERILPKLKRPEQKKWQLSRINAALGKMPVDTVTGLHINDMLKTDLKRGCRASTNKLLETTKQVFNYAAAQHIITVSPAMYLDKSYAGGEQVSRERNLSRAELVTLFQEMAAAPGFDRDNYLTVKLFLLLCVRKCEITQAKKSEFDLDAGLWRLGYDDRKTKTNSAITIPLPRQAVDALRELFTRSGDSGYLLPARKAQNRCLPHISDSTINQALKKKITGIDHFTIHDLRRTGKTKLQEMGIDELTSELCLNHKLKGVSGVYGRHDFLKERQAALQLWANYLESCETGSDWNVTPIRKQA